MERLGYGGLLWLVCCLAVPLSAQPVIYVDDDAPLGGDGKTWNAAYRCLQDALDAAGSEADVLVAGGVYRPDQADTLFIEAGDRSASFELRSGVRLYGGYAGLADIEHPNERDVDLYESILHGDLAGDDQPGFVNNEENSYNVLTAAGVDATAVLDGFTISAGAAEGSCCVHDRGGGLYVEEGSPVVAGCTFRENFGVSGAAIYVNAGGPALDDCLFEQNVSVAGGAGVYYYNADAELTDCTFTGNVTLAGLGGALMNVSATLALVRCTFSDNEALAGGAFFDQLGYGSSCTDCTFTNNVGYSSAGAIYAARTTALLLTRCDFVGNMADGAAGAMQCYGGSATMDDCSFTSNWATSNAGAIYVSDQDLTMTHCEFLDNSSRNGGAFFRAGGAATFSHCTLQGNSAEAGGAMLDLGGDELTFYDCVLADNVSTDSAGGCLYHISGVLRLERCTLSGNSSPYSGGAICSQYNAEIVLEECTATGNQAGRGGAVYNYGAQLDVRNSFFGGNQATSEGGAISNEYMAQVVIMNSTFAGNRSRDGGGEFHRTLADVTVAGCTFCGNKATRHGGGICGDYSVPTVVNCIFWDNSDKQGTGETSQIRCEDTPIVDYSCIMDWSGGWGGTGNIGDDPLFADADGPDDDPNTWEDNDYHLTANSPCVDTGDPNGDYTGQTDIDGQNRVWDGDHNGSALVDMGSDEYDSPTRGDVNCDGAVDLFDADAFVLALREPAEHQRAFPACDRALADVNGDGVVDAFDVEAFVALLIGD